MPQNIILTRVGGGVRNFQIFTDKGGRGVGQFLILADKVEGGMWMPRFVADIKREEPLTPPLIMIHTSLVT